MTAGQTRRHDGRQGRIAPWSGGPSLRRYAVEGITAYLRFRGGIAATDFDKTAPWLLQIHHMFWTGCSTRRGRRHVHHFHVVDKNLGPMACGHRGQMKRDVAATAPFGAVYVFGRSQP